MKTVKITDEAIADMKIASLPTRPTAPSSFGGRGYTATEMKAAFDRLPLYITEVINSLLDDISSEVPGDGIAGAIETGLPDGQSLAELFSDIVSGKLATYLSVGGKSLSVQINELKGEINVLKLKL